MKNFYKPLILFAAAMAAIIVFLFWLKNFLGINPGALLQFEQLVQIYGLPAGIAVAFLGSLWFLPFPYEFAVSPVLTLYSPFYIPIIVLGIASSFADAINFYTGRELGKPIIRKKVKKETFSRIEIFLDKYGLYSLVLFAFIGFVTSYDIVTFVLGGFSNIKFKKFMPLTLGCRIIHYAVIFVILKGVIKAAGLPL